MSNPGKPFLNSVVIFALLSLQGCGGCGFNCDRQNQDPAPLSLSLSGSAADGVEDIVLEIDKITFRRTGQEDVEVDTFTIDALGETNTDTFQVNLTDYQATKQLTVIEDLIFDVDDYDDIVLTIIDGNVNNSYVLNTDGQEKVLNVSSDNTLIVDGFSTNSKDQTFTIKFNLLQSLFYQQSSDDYLLTNKGVRVLDDAKAGQIAGNVDSDLYDNDANCRSTLDDNRIYLYEGTNLTASNLADVYTSDSNTSIPANAISPFDVVFPTDVGIDVYAFGFLPAGDYTLVFTCDADVDDPVDFDNITLPLPSDQIYEISLDEGEQTECDLEVGATCQ